mgnify:CR=1 FL=1
MMTAISMPIWPMICPSHALSAVRIIASSAPAGAVPSSPLVPPTTTVTKLSTMNVAPMVGISVMVGA